MAAPTAASRAHPSLTRRHGSVPSFARSTCDPGDPAPGVRARPGSSHLRRSTSCEEVRRGRGSCLPFWVGQGPGCVTWGGEGRMRGDREDTSARVDTTYLLVSEERRAEKRTTGVPRALHAPWKLPNASSTPPNGARPRRPGAPKSRWKTPRNGPGMDPRSRGSTPPKDRTRKPQRRKKQSRRRRSSSSTSKKCSTLLQRKTSQGSTRHGSVCGTR